MRQLRLPALPGRLGALVAALCCAAALAACGGDDGAPAATATTPRALDLRVAPRAVPAPVGDVDGDRRADAVLIDDGAQRAWLLTSRGHAALVRLDHVRHGPFGQAGHEAVALGDVDGDGLADMALPNDRAGLAIVYGARRWPERLDLRAASAGVGLVRGKPTGRPAEAVARRGDELLAAVDCGVGCTEDRTVRMRIPRAGDSAPFAGKAFPRPVVDAPVRLLAPTAPWASGSDPRVAWLTIKPGPARHETPVVAAPGRRGVLLGPDDVLLGLTHDVALVETQPAVPSGANQTAQLKLYALSSSGTPATRELTQRADFDADGTLAPAGRCVVVSGWGNAPTTVWAVDAHTLDVAGSWSPKGAVSATGAVAGGRISIVAVSRAGRLSRASVALPSGCR
jgi:FG-GAP-like repeat